MPKNDSFNFSHIFGVLVKDLTEYSVCMIYYRHIFIVYYFIYLLSVYKLIFYLVFSFIKCTSHFFNVLDQEIKQLF